jgi:hypothetical protein
MRYTLVPVSKDVARRFVQEHHRHNEAPTPQQVTFCVGLKDDDDTLVAVATAGIPVSRHMADGFTLEVNRSCSIVNDVTANANSRLYGALGRAGKALGYRRLITYTLASEGGRSLLASGFREVAKVKPDSWDNNRKRPAASVTLWGERRQTQYQDKIRWELTL